MTGDFLLYGSYGYTGRLIVERALEVGLRPLLAGRDAAELSRQGEESGLDHVVLGLDDPGALDGALQAVPAVLHAAGPFSRTSRPMAEACLRTATHYVDITGEIEVFEALAAMDRRARAAGVMLLPGAGFDVVPSDCLAAHLKRRLPDARALALAFQPVGGGVSRGTASTMALNAARGGAIRRDGRIRPVPAAWRTRRVDFGRGPVEVTTIPWGDVSTAYHSTGIPDIEVYIRMRAPQRRTLKALRHLGWVVGSAPVQRLLQGAIRRRPAGPDVDARQRGRTLLWGEASGPQDRTVVSRLVVPEGYTLTAMTAVAAVQRILAGESAAGFQTPSSAYGADWILDFDGVEREDLFIERIGDKV